MAYVLLFAAISIMATTYYVAWNLRKKVVKNEVRGRNCPTDRLADAALTYMLLEVYKDKLKDFPDLNYAAYDGSELPSLSGYNELNAVTTYIKHGGEKSEAIERFLDKHLRTPEQMEEFFRRFTLKRRCTALCKTEN